MAQSPYGTPARVKDRCRNCRVCTGFGRQVPSDQRTEPATVIGSGLRDDAAKQYISARHSQAVGGNNSRGPVYNLEDSFGPQHLSLRPNSASYSFSKQVQRPQEGKGRLPGPGQYRMKGGDQALSTHLASSSVCFPLAPRNQADKVYSGAASETAFLGKESPGPMAYDQHHSGIGRQALSARSNAPECHIGQADRFKQSRGGDAGTGLFKLQGSLGLQGVSTKPSLPAYSLGASTRDQMYKVQPG
ncbi:hypothetical protein ABBQ32_013077 [Trebouxia sp. C0010 RCD-2024]